MIAREERPWGWFETLYEEAGLKVKRILVRPGQRLSLQSHARRLENWTVIAGRAVVTVGDSLVKLDTNQAVHVPLAARHRIENPGLDDLVFIEVQQGSYLGEDDIVRYQDDYRRA